MEFSRRSMLMGAMVAAVAAGLADFSVPARAEGASPNEATRLSYLTPAARWAEAVPIGNGRLGAMVFGGVDEEHLELNDDTITAGGPHDPVNPAAREALPELRRLIFEGRYDEATTLAQRDVVSRYWETCYQPLGDLRIALAGAAGAVSDYRRELDLDRAVVTTTYVRNGVRFTREAFVSEKRQAIVVRLTADREGALDVDVTIDGPPEIGTPPWPAAPTESPVWTRSIDDRGDVLMTGNPSPQFGVPAAIRFAARARVVSAGGTRSQSDGTISVRGADRIVVLLTSATNYPVDRPTPDPVQAGLEQMELAAHDGHGRLVADHVRSHQDLYRRVSIDLGRSPAADLPTDRRVSESGTLDDPAFSSLYFQYGRYLLISSSRPGTQAANLQGIWNERVAPPWQSNFTLNINTEMNYWIAEPGGLAECTEPLVGLVRGLAETGARTAEEMYGARGWVAHHNTDLWRGTGAYDGPQGIWPVGGAWLCLHLWDHYDYGRDAGFLAEVYPLMKGACEFFLDTLVSHPEKGWLVTNPSTSPEYSHHDGQTLCAGPTMDMQILRDLFANTARSAEILGRDSELRQQLADARSRLAPHQIGAAGQLQEWLDDWDEIAGEPTHRHISHLYGLYPSGQIDLHTTPELAAAARQTLLTRGDGNNGDGWGVALRAVMWARLGDGERAHQELGVLYLPRRHNANVLNGKTFYQIDANLGGAAAIGEMLMQSVGDEIRVLPALPNAWGSGSVRGLRARGGFGVDTTWSDGRLGSATIRSDLGGRLRVRTPSRVQVKATGGNPTIERPEATVVELDTVPGGTYRLSPV